MKKATRTILTVPAIRKFADHTGTDQEFHTIGDVHFIFRLCRIKDQLSGGAILQMWIPAPNYSNRFETREYRLRPGYTEKQVGNVVDRAYHEALTEINRRRYAEALYNDMTATQLTEEQIQMIHADPKNLNYDDMTKEDVIYWAEKLNAKGTLALLASEKV